MDEFEIQDRILRKKQNSCIHPSWKCTCCQLHKDNYKTQEQAYLIKLELKITEYEEILTSLGFCFEKHNCLSEGGIIREQLNRFRSFESETDTAERGS